MTFTPGTPQRRVVYAWEDEVNNLHKEIVRLSAINAELVAALEGLVAKYPNMLGDEALQPSRAALAKARG